MIARQRRKRQSLDQPRAAYHATSGRQGAQDWGSKGRCLSITTTGLAEESGVEPEEDGGDDDHCSVIEGALLIPSGQSTPLFKSIDAALDHIATGVDRFVKEERPARSRCPLRSLVASLWNRVLDLSLSQQATAAWIAIALVGDEVVWARPRSPPPGGTWNPDAVQDGFQLRTVMALSWRTDDGEWSTTTVTGEMKLGGQPSTAATESLVGWVADPFFSSARLRRRRAPLACW